MFTESSSTYKINLDVFEGTMDLLLYLIKKNDLSIADIPIAFILEEYLKYLDSLKEMNIDLAGDFLLMAAELAYIKSKMLLPEEKSDDADTEEDPRADLVRRLLEYQQYKEAAEKLSSLPQLQRDVYLPLGNSKELAGDENQKGDLLKTDIYKLLDAFAHVLIRLPKEKFHNVVLDRIGVNDRILQLVKLIQKDQVISIEDLFDKPLTRYNVVITFLAVLEMVKLKMVTVVQPDYNLAICIKGAMMDVDEKEKLHLVDVENDSI